MMTFHKMPSLKRGAAVPLYHQLKAAILRDIEAGRWRASGAQVMTTGEKGTITVVTDGRDLKVGTFLQ